MSKEYVDWYTNKPLEKLEERAENIVYALFILTAWCLLLSVLWCVR